MTKTVEEAHKYLIENIKEASTYLDEDRIDDAVDSLHQGLARVKDILELSNIVPTKADGPPLIDEPPLIGDYCLLNTCTVDISSDRRAAVLFELTKDNGWVMIEVLMIPSHTKVGDAVDIVETAIASEDVVRTIRDLPGELKLESKLPEVIAATDYAKHERRVLALMVKQGEEFQKLKQSYNHYWRDYLAGAVREGTSRSEALIGLSHFLKKLEDMFEEFKWFGQ